MASFGVIQVNSSLLRQVRQTCLIQFKVIFCLFVYIVIPNVFFTTAKILREASPSFSSPDTQIQSAMCHCTGQTHFSQIQFCYVFPYYPSVGVSLVKQYTQALVQQNTSPSWLGKLLNFSQTILLATWKIVHPAHLHI